jgi:glutamate racemase
MHMKEAAIGVFDSGVGGLTVLRALMSELPHESFVYLGDTARLPYGIKSQHTIERYAGQAALALIRAQVKCIVVACNTASAVGLPAIRECAGDLPVIGVIEPGAAAACKASPSGRIAVIGTESTVRGGAYQRAIREYRPDALITAAAAQLFVALAEEGLTSGPIADSIARHYLEPLFADSAADTLVLGCTHFPMLLDSIRKLSGPDIHIVDSAETTAGAVRSQLRSSALLASPRDRAVTFFATDSPERFARVGSRFLGQNIQPQQVELIDLHRSS